MVSMAALAAVLVQAGSSAANAKDAPAAITGQVTSDAEGAMEGVVVTAHKDGSIVSVSVTTDKTGHYAFPENRLEPGHYTLAIRAVGYDLAAPAAAELAAERSVVVELQARADQKSRRPAHQRRMDDEHPRHARTRRRSCSTARAATPWNASCSRRMTPTSGCR